MSKIIFPLENKNWMQQNNGDLAPLLVATRNINLERKGYITLSRRMSYLKLNGNYSVTLLAGTYSPAENNYRVVDASNRQFKINQTLTSVTDVSDAGSFSSYSGTDMTYWNDFLWYTGENNLKYATTGAFTDTAVGLNTGVPHPIAIFENKNIICVGNGNTVYSRSSAGVDTAIALTIPTNYVIQWMRYLNNKMYIGTKNKTGGHTFLFEWDGATALATAGYPVNSSWILSGTRYGESLVVITARGELLRFSGGGFVQLAVLPFFENKDLEAETTLTYNSSVIPRGMIAIDEYLYIYVASGLYENGVYGIKPNFPSGIYQYHKDTGLTHRATLSTSNNSSITDYGQTYTDTPGCIIPLVEKSVASNPILANGSRFIVGARGYTDFTTNNAIASLTSGESRGSFVTCKIPTSEITGTTQKLFIKWKNMFDSTDKIIVKYRNAERRYLPLGYPGNRTYNMIWTSTTTFTMLSSDTQINLAQVGDEVEIVSGNGAGSLAHIIAISNVGATYTVTLDEAITGVVNGNRSGCIIDNWTKSGIATFDNLDAYQEFNINTNGKWVQFKIELRGANEVQIEEMQILTQPNIISK